MAEISEVKYWGRHGRGVGHAIMWKDEHGYSFTLCGCWGNFTVTEDTPRRICCICRRNLKKATIKPQGEEEAR